jgi:2-polyprenyl-3-methyl-5-hydroxy-6-metoxy-1,4-benzoquinol methylase
MPTDLKPQPEMESAWANASLWDREYEVSRAIPSSHRTEISHTFRHLRCQMQIRPGLVVLDAGSGTGRHALHLARAGCQVDAVDISTVALQVLSDRWERMVGASVAGSVQPICSELSARSLPDRRYDLIVDSYVSCHLLSQEDRNDYLDALCSLLSPDGVLYTSAMGVDDEYYSAHVVSQRGRDTIALDPMNGIRKRLQPKSTFREGLSEVAVPQHSVAESFSDAVAGVATRRQVLAALLTRH